MNWTLKLCTVHWTVTTLSYYYTYFFKTDWIEHVNVLCIKHWTLTASSYHFTKLFKCITLNIEFAAQWILNAMSCYFTEMVQRGVLHYHFTKPCKGIKSNTELCCTLNYAAHWTVCSMSCYVTKPFTRNKLNTELSFALHTDCNQLSFH